MDKKDFLVKKHGFRIFIDPRITPVKWIEIIRKGIYERCQIKLFKKECKKGMTVLDLGAQYGYYSFIAAKLVGSRGKVFSFEPNPDCHSLLLKGIEANGFTNVVPVCKAISNTNGSTSIYQPYITDDEDISFSAETVTLDDFLKDCEDNIDIIKMDIEGAELFAVGGMKNILKSNLKIFLELHPTFIRQFGGSPRDCLNVLLKNNFEIYLQEDSHDLVEVDLDNIDDNVRHYFCYKGAQK